jgi:transcription initiation factor TFIID TATA-box-binding protein
MYDIAVVKAITIGDTEAIFEFLSAIPIIKYEINDFIFSFYRGGELKNLTIVNVVATANLLQKIDLNALSRAGLAFNDKAVDSGLIAYSKNKEMKGKVSIITSRKMNGKVSIFASGKMISVGTNNEVDALKDLENVKDTLVSAGVILPISIQIKVPNIVATFDLQKKIDLENLAIEQGMVYEPEQFPGVIFKIDKPYKSTILIFSSGKLVITGLKNKHQIEQTARHCKEMLAGYIRK